MFKKAVVVNQQKLRGSDVKRLKRDMQLAMPALTEADVDSAIPGKADVIMYKLSNRAVVYAVDGRNPLVFDPEGENDLYPTVYLLWAFPKALDSLLTYSEVSPKILGGADLMLQGVHPAQATPASGAGSWEEDDKRSVILPDNHFPFGVGSMVVSSASLASTGLKGRGLKLLHHYPDTIWQMGDKCVPDASFTAERVYPLGVVPEGAAPSAPPPPPPAPEPPVVERVAALSLASDAPASPAATPAGGASSSSETDAIDTSTPEGMDAMLDWCLLRGLVEKVPDSELPIKCEELYSKVMLPIRPAGTTVDIKKSGYKKLTKLYTVWEKKGLLTVKAVHKIDNIIAVNRTHAAYVAAVAAAKAAPTTADAGSAAGAAAAPAAALIEVDPMYRSPSSLRPIFGDLLAVNKERLLSEADVAGALRAYAAANGLSPGGDGVIALDELLSGGLYGKKEPETVGTPVVAAALLPRVLAKLNQFTRLRITRAGGAAPEEVLQKGSIKNIRITAEDRHAGRKHVTRVTGLEFFAIEPEELSSRIQKGFNTSCSVALLPGKFETLKEVAAQGNLLQEVTDLLQKEYGIPTAYLDVVSKLK